MNLTIYVKLLNEDVDVWRPVLAEMEKDTNSFLILPFPANSIPQGEQWEFKPGTRVLIKEINLENKIVKVASKEITG